ncbi:MAG TPA: baseplate J/gp47 family protein [Ornithinimicrobium sp.]|nr:baseplate J/gp47 family protein [Ornithinimicrobium sp.]
MSIPVPNLDDRSFAELVEAARARIQQVDPEWRDLSVHDPGIVLVEAFAHLTDMLMYRLNRVPEKLYATYLNLLGTSQRPPSAAHVVLEFTRTAADGGPVRIPRGTRVGCPPGVPGAAQPVFATLTEAVLGEGEASVAVEAADVVLHEAEVLGVGSGMPGQTFTIPEVPVVGGPGLTIGVEVPDAADVGAGGALRVDGLIFRMSREVDVFADAAPGEPVVRVDRTAGRVMFPWWAPGERPDASTGSVGPVVPGPGAQVRAWYRTGGGERGNVAVGTVTVLRDPLPGVRVTNPEPATGGGDVEPLDQALRRAPQEFQARDRAVTARDYEVLAARHGAVARARALTRREVWSFAALGEVEVVLVPSVPVSSRSGGRVTAEDLAAHSREEVRAEVDARLRDVATIGAVPLVRWARCKAAAVHARVVVRPDEDPEAVRGRIVRRLDAAISPLPDGAPGFGSGFGRALRVSNLYQALEQAEPGVQYVDAVRVVLDRVPDADAMALVGVDSQPGTWFVGQGDTLFRTTNGADGWEACAVWEQEEVRAVSPVRGAVAGRPAALARPGMVAVATAVGDGARVYVSEDLGESWRRVAELGFGLADLTWVERNGTPVLLMAGQKGLYELALAPGAVPVQNLVDPAQPDRGFHAVDTIVDIRGATAVVVIAEASAGVWLSPTAGAPGSFGLVRPPGEDVRCLSVQYDGPAAFLWIGFAVPEGQGAGCARVRLDDLARTDLPQLATAWEELREGWSGGSCWGVEVVGDTAYAATQSGGVVRLRLGGSEGSWSQPDVNSGLPLRDRARFDPVRAVSGALRADGEPVVLAAGPRGVLRSTDAGVSWRTCSARIVEDVVTLPPTWLFCSGEHEIEVIRAHG